MENEIINKVANSGLITIDLEEFLNVSLSLFLKLHKP